MNIPSRMSAARRRYGRRALLVLLYRALDWAAPVRSTLQCAKVRWVLGGRVGAGVHFGKGVHLPVPSGRVVIGGDTWFSDRCVLAVSANPVGRLTVGAGCYFSRDVHLAALQEITIGDHVRVGEFASLHDSDHAYRERNRRITEQGDVPGRIVVGDDVWIGRGALLLGRPDALVIGPGAVIGANAVVLKSVPAYAIAVGAPARVIGYRE